MLVGSFLVWVCKDFFSFNDFGLALWQQGIRIGENWSGSLDWVALWLSWTENVMGQSSILPISIVAHGGSQWFLVTSCLLTRFITGFFLGLYMVSCMVWVFHKIFCWGWVWWWWLCWLHFWSGWWFSDVVEGSRWPRCWALLCSGVSLVDWHCLHAVGKA